MDDDALPPAPMAHRLLGLAAIVAVVGGVAYGFAQYRAQPETDMALAFLNEVRQEAPTARTRAAGDALAVLDGQPGESSPGLNAARDSRSFQAVHTHVQWGARCIEVHAYGTTRYTLFVEVLEEAEEFRVTRVVTMPTHNGPCAPD
ncbi:MAG: hypothetical protein H6726_00975 [Sandaracinaceae bacterium]|nr:hypothetical protein [Myxococcales bacterium]MCB9656192.1 hypothetical protein [Sandaracinaceae bacterium]